LPSLLFGIGVSFAAYDPNMVIIYGSITGLLLFISFAFEFAYLIRGKTSS
jgi:POT family proton-dependent oligopeptide transporter